MTRPATPEPASEGSIQDSCADALADRSFADGLEIVAGKTRSSGAKMTVVAGEVSPTTFVVVTDKLVATAPPVHRSSLDAGFPLTAPGEYVHPVLSDSGPNSDEAMPESGSIRSIGE